MSHKISGFVVRHPWRLALNRLQALIRKPLNSTKSNKAVPNYISRAANKSPSTGLSPSKETINEEAYLPNYTSTLLEGLFG